MFVCWPLVRSWVLGHPFTEGEGFTKYTKKCKDFYCGPFFVLHPLLGMTAVSLLWGACWLLSYCIPFVCVSGYFLFGWCSWSYEACCFARCVLFMPFSQDVTLCTFFLFCSFHYTLVLFFFCFLLWHVWGGLHTVILPGWSCVRYSFFVLRSIMGFFIVSFFFQGCYSFLCVCFLWLSCLCITDSNDFNPSLWGLLKIFDAPPSFPRSYYPSFYWESVPPI